MIFTYETETKRLRQLLKKLCCPVCLSDLVFVHMDQRNSHLQCDSCKNSFIVTDGLPYFLIEDESFDAVIVPTLKRSRLIWEAVQHDKRSEIDI